MNSRRFLKLLLLVLSFGVYHGSAFSTTLSPAMTPLHADIPRYGLNLGGSGQWGAEQLRSNILNNPGFEAVLDRTIFIVGQKAFHHLTDDNNWLAREDGFWNQGTYHVLTGNLQGQTGRILDSVKNRKNEAEIAIGEKTMPFSRGDVLALTRHSDLNTPYGWRVLKGHVLNERDDLPVNPAGRQAVHLTSTSVVTTELVQYFDNIADRAGQLLPVRGTWHFTFKAKGLKPGSEFMVHFNRNGQPAFLNETVKLTRQWQEYTLTFEGTDSTLPGVLTLSLQSLNGDMLLDDTYLGAAQPGIAGFRPEVIETLKQLKPGFLRDWQGQLADTFENRIAGEWRHQPVRYRDGANEVQHHYSLPDFLALCAEIGATPWIVAPTTFDETDWQALGAYLKQVADHHRFGKIMVEFGNENWNPLFRPGGIIETQQHAIAADRAFTLLKKGSNHDTRITTIVNAQFADPDNSRQMAERSQTASHIAVAPYFFYRLNRDMTVEQARDRVLSDSDVLFQQEMADASRNNKRLAVYEVNLHTTLGSADAGLINQIVTSGISGVALARRLIQGSLNGIQEQAVYTLSGFDTYQEHGKGLIHLWGITRDLTRAGYFRPTGLALRMLNSVAGGKTYALNCTGENCAALTGIVFDKLRAAIVSSSPIPLTVTLTLNCRNAPYSLHYLDGEDLTRNNEQQEQVHIRSSQENCQENGQIAFTLAPFSLLTLSPATIP